MILNENGAVGTGDKIPAEVFESLQKAFIDFQVRAEELSRAYSGMQQDFKKVNLELDRKNAELAGSLAKQEEIQTYLNSILHSMDNGVVGVDVNGVITHFNRAASEITGYACEEVLNSSYSEIFSGSEQSGCALLDTLHTEREVKRDEKVLWTVDNHPVPVLFHTAVLKDKNGKKLGAVEIFSDISRFKALEKEMQQTRTMAALGEMSATVAHEIRNPLGAMGMWAGLLERDLEPQDPRRKTLGRITEGLSKLNKIVSNLLVYTRPLTAEFRKVRLCDLLEETVDFTQIEIERLERDIAVEKDFSEGEDQYVLADPEKVSQAIMNVCLNAVQAMESGGTLAVRFEKESKRGSNYITFTISDTGSGIEEESLAKIFDPFFTTKENGTGLGLAIVKKIFESHSGYIDIKSVVGEGTSVRMFLPRLKD
ncbi:MAG: two-component system sensor histidine kinase NtrB [Chitinispirillaceae bacterium]